MRGSSVLRQGEARAATVTSGTLRHSLRTRDITLRVPSKDRLSCTVFCSTRDILRQAVDRHDWIASTNAHAPFLRLVGTHITFTNLLAALQEGEERVESRFTADEATVATSALALGECVAYLSPSYNAELMEKSGALPFPLKVDRILYNQPRPFTSLVNAHYEELVCCDASKVVGERDVGRRLAEGYLRTGAAPPSLSEGDGATATAEAVPPPPFSLELQHVDRRRLVEYFSYNVTLHGYTYFRRSNGSVSALGLYSAVDEELLQAVPKKPNGVSKTQSGEGALGDDEHGEAERRREALQAAFPASYGVLVQPFAAGNAVDWSLWKLQRALTAAAAVEGTPLSALHERAVTAHTACQDTLSLVTGDYEGAFVAATVARQYTEDPGRVAAVVEPLRRQLGIDDVRVPLDGAEATRTGLDFFCRCSTAGLLASLIGLPEERLRSLQRENTFRCTYCGRVHHPTPSEWEHLFRSRESSSG